MTLPLLLLLGAGCVRPGAMLPAIGWLQYQEPMLMVVPGGRVDLAGGSLIVHRVDLSLDTRLGTQEIGAVYDSAAGRWQWSFDLSYDGRVFTDETGARHDVSAIADGAALPGTAWVKVDARSIQTKGGMVYEFDPLTSRLQSQHWSDRFYPNLSYTVRSLSTGDRVVDISQCKSEESCESVYAIGYDQHGCVNSISDWAGRRALFEQTAGCLVSRARDALDVARGWPGFRYLYRGSLLVRLTNSEGESVRYDYFEHRLVRVCQLGETIPIWEFVYGYNSLNGLYFSRVDDPMGGSAIFRYDELRRLRERVDAVGDLTRFEWDGLRPASRTAPGGAVTRWEYIDDDPVRLILPSGNIVEVEYARSAVDRQAPTRRPLLRVSDSLGPIEEREYDSAGRVVSVTNGAGETSRFEYDSLGDLARVVDAAGNASVISNYGANGHAQHVERAGTVDERVYDAVGNLVNGLEYGESLSPGRPGVGRRFFDEDRNLVSVELAASTGWNCAFVEVQSMTIEYRSDGRRTAIRRPYGGDVEFIYDGLGRMIERRERSEGQWRSTHFEFDSLGRPIATALPNGMRREADYDAIGRRQALRSMRDGIIEKQVAFEYEGGLLRSMRDSSYGAAESFAYDAAGRRSRIVFPAGEVMELGYDARSRLVSRRLRLASGAELLRTLTLGYDGADRIVAWFDDGQSVLEKVYAEGRLAEVVYGNGLHSRLAYDPNSGLPSGSETRNEAGDLLIESVVDRFPCPGQTLCVSNETSAWWEVVAGEREEEEMGKEYLLSPHWTASPPSGSLGERLVGWSAYRRPPFGAMGIHLAYDFLGNWLGEGQDSECGSALQFDSEHSRLLSDRQAVYSYDAAGYLKTRGQERFEWDAGGRVTRLGDAAEFGWDALGRPLWTSIGGVVSRTRFGGFVLADVDGQPAAIDLGEFRISLADETRLYRHLDFRNNVGVVSDERGEVVAQYDYEPYRVSSATDLVSDGRNFAQGKQVGRFVLLGARPYDPDTARFIGPDPLYDPINQYAYTRGNPLKFWDPSGSWSIPIPIPITAKGAQKLADQFVLVGTGVLVTGLSTGNPPLSGAGIGMITAGMGTTIAVETLPADAWLPPPAAAGSVGAQPSAPPASLPKTSATQNCAPVAMVGFGERGRLLAGLVLLQLLLAALGIRYRSRSRRDLGS